MASLIPRAIADVELQLASAISVGGTSFTLNSANDDDGNALPAGLYCFTIDSGTSNKEYLIGQLNSTSVTSVKTVTRQGVESSGAARAHRVGAPCIVTNFATLQRVADILRGQLELDGANPILYDAEPTLADRKELATVGYVLDTVSGGTVAFDSQTISGTAGESVVAGNLVYFKTSDQEWYKTDADTAATVEGVQLGIALGTGSDGVSISGGVLISGTYTTTGLTAGSLYYASNTAGAISTSAGTTSQVIGLALSTTKLLLIPRNPQTVTSKEKDALVGGGDFGTPSSSNKFVTQDFLTGNRIVYELADSPATWTKPSNLLRIRVQLWGGGGSGGASDAVGDNSGGGGGGGYSEFWFEESVLGATETVTVGAGGASRTSAAAGAAGGNTTFGSLLTAYGGSGGGSSNTDVAGGNGGGPNTDSNNYGVAASAAVGGNGKLWGGGAGGGVSDTSGGFAGGSALFGGGGGGGVHGSNGSSTLAGGTSTFGGAGGASSRTANATAGSVPGGGGGGAALTYDSGAGGAGRCIVTEYFA